MSKVRGKRRTTAKRKKKRSGVGAKKSPAKDIIKQDEEKESENNKIVVENVKNPQEVNCQPSSEDGFPAIAPRIYPRTLKFTDEELDMLCEWEDCSFRSEDLGKFVSHVEYHIPQLAVKVLSSGEVVYICRWVACEFECVDRNEISRHVNYHAFHTKIKCVGSNICQRTGVPACNYHELGRNVIPDIPNSYRCNWEDCTDTFQNAQKFYNHVECHLRGHSCEKNIRNCYRCQWGLCKGRCPTKPKLRDHLRSHTQEKMVGCPVCGGVFATRAKYFDHCKRQIPLEMHGYQCSHCFKFYPSERLLKGHMRLHVNHYKCPFCDMTCPGPASLSNHIRFRHLDDKPFKCELCNFRGKTQSDLACHQRVHLPDGFYKCTEEGCEYSARSPNALSWHYRRVHGNQVHPMYCCHICDARYSRGFYLTRHLVNKHSFQWPSGHSRFRYKLHEDGLYRLETVRYESLEVTQKLMSERETQSSSKRKIIQQQNKWQYPYKGFIETDCEDDVDDPEYEPMEVKAKGKNRVKPDTPLKLRSPVIEGEFEQNDSDNMEGTRNTGKLIEIAVEELDERGQVVKLEFIHTTEVQVTSDEGCKV